VISLAKKGVDKTAEASDCDYGGREVAATVPMCTTTASFSGCDYGMFY